MVIMPSVVGGNSGNGIVIHNVDDDDDDDVVVVMNDNNNYNNNNNYSNNNGGGQQNGSSYENVDAADDDDYNDNDGRDDDDDDDAEDDENGTTTNFGTNDNNNNYYSYIDDTTRSTLVKLVEDHITVLLRQAITIQRHSKRSRIHLYSNNNIDSSNSNNNSINNVGSKNRLHATDINLALQLMGSEKLYGTPLVTPTATTSNSNNDETTSNKRIYLQEFLRTEEIPKPPTEIGIQYHWLAIDGVQPNIPQNPDIVNTITIQQQQSQSQSALVSNVGGSTVIVPSQASSILGNNNNNTSTTTTTTTTTGVGTTSTATTTTTTTTTGGSANNTGATLQINQLQSSLLSEELKLYFTRLTSSIEIGTIKQQDTIIQSLATDPGLQELVPFLVWYCQKELFQHVASTSTASASTSSTKHPAEHCRTVLRFVRALVHNPHVHLELHLHELLPALVTCVVAQKLCNDDDDSTSTIGQQQQRSSTSISTSTHWIVRSDAARVLYEACQSYHTEYPTLKSRIISALCHAIGHTTTEQSTSTTTTTTKKQRKKKKHGNKKLYSTSSSLPSQYGGIVGLTLFGPRCIDSFVVPMILANWEQWELTIQDVTISTSIKYEIQLCQQASLNALGLYLRSTITSIDEKIIRLWDPIKKENILQSLFYDRLIPISYCSTSTTNNTTPNSIEQPMDYSMCFI